MIEVIDIARCAEHGLHGCRTRCFECGEEVEQVSMAAIGDGPAVDRPRQPELAALGVAVERARDLAIAAVEHVGFTEVQVVLNVVAIGRDTTWIVGSAVPENPNPLLSQSLSESAAEAALHG